MELADGDAMRGQTDGQLDTGQVIEAMGNLGEDGKGVGEGDGGESGSEAGKDEGREFVNGTEDGETGGRRAERGGRSAERRLRIRRGVR